MRKSLFGGYPHNGIKSLEILPNRVGATLVSGKVMLVMNKEHFTFPKSIESQRDFCFDRIYDYTNALAIAEQQISDMQAEYPFIPQSFGFQETDLILNPHGFSPTCYTKGKYMIANVEDYKWIITGVNNGDGITIDLPNIDVAFITLRALGVISDDQFNDPTDILVKNAEVDVLGGETIKNDFMIIDQSTVETTPEVKSENQYPATPEECTNAMEEEEINKFPYIKPIEGKMYFSKTEESKGGRPNGIIMEECGSDPRMLEEINRIQGRPKTEEIRITDDGIKMEEKNDG